VAKDDVRSVGRSKIVPFIPGEAAMDRHDRRKNENLKRADTMRTWCRAVDVSFKISNDGHHWRFRSGDRFAEWWPSSAKLVRQGDYDRGIHVHDVHQAINILSGHFKTKKSRTVTKCEICGKDLDRPLEVALQAHEGSAPLGVCFGCGSSRIDS
jgi:hypothetical protein